MQAPPPQPYLSQQASYPAPRQTNVLAIVGLVCAFVCWPAGIVCSAIARHQIRQTGEDGDGMALAGLIVSIVVGVINVIVIIVVLAAIAHVSQSTGTTGFNGAVRASVLFPLGT